MPDFTEASTVTKLTIPKEDQQAIARERFCCPDPHICRRLHALHLKSLGKSHEEIAAFVDLSLNSLHRLFKKYTEGGLAAIRTLHYTNPISPLDQHKKLLIKHFEEHPPASVKQARDEIEKLTGVRRGLSRIREFLHQLGMMPRKVGGIPSRADPERQEDFKKKAWGRH
jgi:transposase